MKDAAEEGGGPAGVVDGLFEAAKENKLLLFPNLLSGVEGSGLEEYSKPGMLQDYECDNRYS